MHFFHLERKEEKVLKWVEENEKSPNTTTDREDGFLSKYQ